MKALIKLSVSLVLFIFLLPTNIKAQCHIDDWTALKALYENTNGDYWINRIGWDVQIDNRVNPPANCNLQQLEGVDLNSQGRVKWLRLHSNQLNGSIPSEIGNLTNLTILNLFDNQLNGSVPLEIGTLTNLVSLSLHSNTLTGSIPSEIGSLTNLTTLILQNNKLSGAIPQEIGNMSSLTFISFYENNLNSSIPFELGNLGNLIELRLGKNKLSGNIPPQIGNLNNLTKLYLFNNQLNGNIPSELGNLSNLTLLKIHNNNLSGCYPTSILSFCDQLTDPGFSGSPDVSHGNNFDINWDDFCANGAGICSTDDVYPGDLNHDGIVNNQDIGLWGLFLYETGPPRTAEHQSTNWNPYPAQDWNRQQINNEDIKHFDTNGNGAIEEDDCQAVTDNFGQSWSPTSSVEIQPPEVSDYQVMLHPIDEVVDGFLVMNVALERRTGGSIELRGGHFTVDYGDIPGNISTAALNFEPFSWLGVPTIDLWYESTPFPAEKKIEVGFTKTDNVNSEGNGVIGQLILAYDNGGARLSKKSNMYEFRVNTIGVHNSETFTQMEDQTLQVNVDNSNYCQTNWSIDENTPFQNQ